MIKTLYITDNEDDTVLFKKVNYSIHLSALVCSGTHNALLVHKYKDLMKYRCNHMLSLMDTNCYQ